MNLSIFHISLAIMCYYLNQSDYIHYAQDCSSQVLNVYTKRLLNDQLPQQIQKLLIYDTTNDIFKTNYNSKNVNKNYKIHNNIIAQGYKCVTVLFSDIKGFTQFSSSIVASDLVSILNDLYTIFDILTDIYNVTNIETIGDAYLIAGGLFETRKDHTLRMVLCGLDMITVLENLDISLWLESGLNMVDPDILYEKRLYDQRPYEKKYQEELMQNIRYIVYNNKNKLNDSIDILRAESLLALNSRNIDTVTTSKDKVSQKPKCEKNLRNFFLYKQKEIIKDSNVSSSTDIITPTNNLYNNDTTPSISDTNKNIQEFDFQRLQMRVGIHCGDVVGGVVGKKVPRYHLFGDTVTIANYLESNSRPNRVQLSEQAIISLCSSDNFENDSLQFLSLLQLEYRGKYYPPCMETPLHQYWVFRKDNIPLFDESDLDDEKQRMNTITVEKYRNNQSNTKDRKNSNYIASNVYSLIS